MNRRDVLAVNNRRPIFNNNGRIVQFFKRHFTRSRRIFTIARFKRIATTTTSTHRHRHHDHQLQQRQQQLDPPRWTMVTININAVGELTTYQINGVLLCVLAIIPLLFFAFYQFGRVLGLLEVVLFGIDDILRTTCFSITRIFTRLFF